MERITITVKVPALNNTYDFIVPSNMTVQNAQNLILQILSSEYGISTDNTDVMLFDISDNTALSIEHTFEQLGISDGDQLLLI